MGSEKAFLRHRGVAFITAISAEMAKVSDDIIVMTGAKDEKAFERFLEPGVRVFRDDEYLSNPLGGILSGLAHVVHPRVAIVGCDTPLLKAEVIDYLRDAMGDHAAAVPIGEGRDATTMEPLCAVYSVPEVKRAAFQAAHGTRKTAKRMVTLIGDVRYVEASLLRSVDPTLDSLVDVNTPEEYAALERRSPPHTLVQSAVKKGEEC